MFNSVVFTTGVFEPFEIFAFKDNDNHRETEGNCMNKFPCAVLYCAIVKSL